MKTTIAALALIVLGTEQLASISAAGSVWSPGNTYPPAVTCLKGCPVKPVSGKYPNGVKGAQAKLPPGVKESVVKSK